MTALLRGDNELLRESLAAAEKREAELRVQLADLRSKFASTSTKLTADCQRRQAALDTSRTQNAVLTATLAATREESAAREAARVALAAELVAAGKSAAAAAAAADAAAADAAAALEAERGETTKWRKEAELKNAALKQLGVEHAALKAAHAKLRLEASELAESVERLQHDIEARARAAAASAAREAALRDDLAAAKADIARLTLAYDAEKLAHATAVAAALADAAAAERVIRGLTADALKREEYIAKLRFDLETLEKWRGEAEVTIAKQQRELKKHKVAAMLAKAVGESKEGDMGRRLRECQEELEEANGEIARLNAELGALQRELERTREEAADAAEVAAHALQAGSRPFP